ncbi:hypothetical protein [Micromonospora sp. NBC_00421]|uniref:hypothetical protein n=1 Tax=Micromonospora sp. NBC_00421 TaxID=2975976 RepID=UPI002E1ED25A
MEPGSLASDAIGLLAALAQGTLQGVGAQAGEELYDLVAAQMRTAGERPALEAFEEDPTNTAIQRRFRAALAHELAADPQFRATVSRIAEKAVDGNASVSFGNTVNSPTNILSGEAQQGDRYNYGHQGNKINFGGILIAVVAVVALFFAGRAIYVSVGGDSSGGTGLSESSTCTEYLSKDDATRKETMRRLYLEAGKADRAGDAFILQNADYECGQRPKSTLAQIVG